MMPDLYQLATRLTNQRINQAIAQRVRWLRTSRGFSPETQAERLELTLAEYDEYETGTTPVPASALFRLAVLHDQPIEWFYDAVSHIPDDICTCEGCGGLRITLR